MSWSYDAMIRIQTELKALSTAPDEVAIVPKGHETKSVPKAKTFWITLHPKDDDETPEAGAAYIVDYIIVVTIWIKSNAVAETIVSTQATKISDVRGKLRYNSLSGWARIEILGGAFLNSGYIDGEDSESVYGYQFNLKVTHQYTS